MSFESLGLVPALLRALADGGIDTPTPVQREAIPVVLAGRDLLASAQTGSGKTVAYALPLLQRLASHSGATTVQALVLVPTRELAVQVGGVIETFARVLPGRLKVVTAYGGLSVNPQMMALRGGAAVVVATPGRLLDLLDRNALSLSALETLVLDEADRLFDLGFADELKRVLREMPTRRQTLLFSATFPDAVKVLAASVLRDPVQVEITSEEPPAIVQRAFAVDPDRRTQLLRTLISEQAWTQVLVFVATRYATEHVATKLRRASINAVALHGDLAQGVRSQALADFKAGKVRVLVATDVAARGIDILQLPVVVNYDLPRSTVDYVHRIGRTGRAGEAGIAVSFVSADTEAHFRLIEKRHAGRLVRETLPGFEPVLTEPAAPTAAPAKAKRGKPHHDEGEEESRAPAQPSVWPAHWGGKA